MSTDNRENDACKWQNNKEMNPAANSSETGEEVNITESEPSEGGTATQKAADLNRSGSPGPTPGKAEGVEDPEEDGNQ